jgi:hypothetical protein
MRRRTKLFQDSLLFLISQITDRFILDVPRPPLIFRGVISETLCIPADLVELPGPKTNYDVPDPRLAFIFNPCS